MNTSLESFLGGDPVSAPVVETVPVADVVVAEPVVIETPTPEPESEPAAAKPDAAIVEDDDDAPPASANGQVPLHVLQAERTKRRDYKAQVIRQEEQLKAAKERAEALEARLEELRKAPAPAAVAPPAPATLTPPAQPAAVVPEPAVPMPNPIEDPDGYARWQEHRQAMAAFNIRLETTEELLRDKEGDEAVDRAIGAFKEMVAAEEMTFGKGRSPLAQSLTVQRNPYKWMYSTVKKADADKEIGGDLAAYKAKTREAVRAELEAEIRAKIEAEMAGRAVEAPAVAPITIAPAVQRPAAPAVNLPRSLATATSAAPRSAVAWTGPTALSDIVPRR
jgi:hypothetical protein